MVNPLFATLIALIVAYTLSEILKIFGVPRVIGQISAGILLGTTFLKNILFTQETYSIFEFISNIGIILLFFFIGLEISLRQFKQNFKESSMIAIFNTIIPLVSGFLVGKYFFHFNNIVSIIIGISVSVSSQSISLDILEEVKLLKTKIGNLIMTSGTVDDVFELLLISVILVIFHSAIGHVSFQKLVVDAVIFILLVVVAKVLLIPFALKIFEREKSQANMFMGGLIIVLLMAYLSEILGIGSLIGALIAGILVRQTLLTGPERKPWRKNELSHSIHIVAFGFLIPVFFVNVGLKMDLGVVSSNLLLVFVLLLIDIVGTLVGTITGVLLSKGSLTEGLIVGWAVIPKGDTELVIATLALSNGLIDIGIFSAIITVAIISTLIAPVIFRFLVRNYSGMSKTTRHT